MATNKVLIVDDDPNILDLLANYLDLFGFAHSQASDGREAVEVLKKDRFSIVLTDMMMPNMDGMELLQHIRENHPDINVIVVTGYDRTFTYTDVIRAGASDFISKPFDADELEAKLNRIVREQELVRQLEHLSLSDGLTDLYNRRYFDIKIFEEVQRGHRQGHQIFLLLVDVDNLKDYNDKLGHQAGDELLKTVGEILHHYTRENVDWPCRYGGDEFSVILTHVNEDQALKTAERIKETFRNHNFSIAGLSIGIARFVRHSNTSWQEDITDLIRRTDKALYQAKAEGRDRIVVNHDEEAGNETGTFHIL